MNNIQQQLMVDLKHFRTVIYRIDKTQRDVIEGDFDITAIPELVNKQDFPRIAIVYFATWQHALISRGEGTPTFLDTLENLIFRAVVCALRYPKSLPLCSHIKVGSIVGDNPYLKKLKVLRENRDLLAEVGTVTPAKVFSDGGIDE